MSSPTWNEYLLDARRHLSEVRGMMQSGGPVPLPPVRPKGSVPQELLDEVKVLSESYDELVLEVAERMQDLRLQISQPPKSPHQDQAPASYIDTSA